MEKKKYLPRYKIDWCCRISLHNMICILMILLVILCATLLWTASHFLLINTLEEANESTVVSTISTLSETIISYYDTSEIMAGRVCSFAQSEMIQQNDEASLSSLLPLNMILLQNSYMPINMLQYGTSSVLVITQPYHEVSVNNNIYLGAYTVNGSETLTMNVMHPLYGIFIQETGLIRIVDTLQEGPHSVHTTDEWNRIFYERKSTWHTMEFSPTIQCISQQITYPCYYGFPVRNESVSAVVVGIYSLRHYLCTIVKETFVPSTLYKELHYDTSSNSNSSSSSSTNDILSEEEDDEKEEEEEEEDTSKFAYILQANGDLLGASVPKYVFDDWMVISGPYSCQYTAIHAEEFYDKRIAQSSKIILHDLIADGYIDESTGTLASSIHVQREYSDESPIITSHIYDEVSIGGEKYTVGYQYYYYAATTLSHIIVVVIDNKEMNQRMRQHAINNLIALSCCIGVLITIVLCIIQCIKPIRMITNIIKQSNYRYFTASDGDTTHELAYMTRASLDGPPTISPSVVTMYSASSEKTDHRNKRYSAESTDTDIEALYAPTPNRWYTTVGSLMLWLLPCAHVDGVWSLDYPFHMKTAPSKISDSEMSIMNRSLLNTKARRHNRRWYHMCCPRVKRIHQRKLHDQQPHVSIVEPPENQPQQEDEFIQHKLKRSKHFSGNMSMMGFIAETDHLNGIARTSQDIANILTRNTSSLYVEHMLNHPSESGLCTHLYHVSTMFVDLRSYTAYTNKNRATLIKVSDLMKIFFSAIDKATKPHGISYSIATIGDAKLICFGGLFAKHDLLHAKNSILSAIDIQDNVPREVEKLTGNYIYLSTGVATGVAIAGNIGTDERNGLDILGNTVNVSARVQNIHPSALHPLDTFKCDLDAFKNDPDDSGSITVENIVGVVTQQCLLEACDYLGSVTVLDVLQYCDDVSMSCIYTTHLNSLDTVMKPPKKHSQMTTPSLSNHTNSMNVEHHLMKPSPSGSTISTARGKMNDLNDILLNADALVCNDEQDKRSNDTPNQSIEMAPTTILTKRIVDFIQLKNDVTLSKSFVEFAVEHYVTHATTRHKLIRLVHESIILMNTKNYASMGYTTPEVNTHGQRKPDGRIIDFQWIPQHIVIIPCEPHYLKNINEPMAIYALVSLKTRQAIVQ